MITIENPETGETKNLFPDKFGKYHMLHIPWRVVGSIQADPQARQAAQKQARIQRMGKLAILAEKHGLPVADFLDAARWLLQKDCPYCQLGTQILRRVQELGAARTQELIARILAAKADGNSDELERIRLDASN